MKLDALAKRIQKGDSSACAELVNQYGKMVYYTAYAELGDKDKSLDATKRVFRELFTSMRKGDVPTDPIKHLQRQLRVQTKCLDSEDSIMNELISDIQSTSEGDLLFSGVTDETPAPSDERASFERQIPTVEPEAPVVGEYPAAQTVQGVSNVPNVPAVEASTPTQAIPIIEPNVSQDDDDDDDLADRDSALYQQFYGQAEQIGAKKMRVGHVLLILLIVILVLLLVWVVLGFLVKVGAISGLDLGYSWFNSNIFSLF